MRYQKDQSERAEKTGFVTFYFSLMFILFCSVENLMAQTAAMDFQQLVDSVPAQWLMIGVAVLLLLVLFLLIRVLALGGNVRKMKKQSSGAGAEPDAEFKHQVLDELSIGSLEMDLSGVIYKMNKSAAHMLGYKKNELVGEPVHKIITEDDMGFIRNLGEKNQGSIDVAMQTKDAEELHCNINYELVDVPGKKKYIKANITDISKERHLQSQLQQAEKMGSIGKFAGGIVHDFNNVITIVRGYCQLLDVKMDPESPHLPTIHKIERASEKAEFLSRRLLTFSRKNQPKHVVFDVNESIEKLKQFLEPLLPENTHLKLDFESEQAFIKVDKNQFEHVLVNLTTNARDAMPEGGDLVISTETVNFVSPRNLQTGELPAGTFVRVSIKDMGTGMDKETLENIFKPFYTTKETGKGTGLGLSIVKNFVDQSRGYIDIKSQPGQGSQFDLYFEKTDEAAKEGKEKYFPDQNINGSEKILVVEDDEQVRPMIDTVLSDYGYQVETCDGTESGIHDVFNNKVDYDVVVLDAITPYQNGPKIVQELKKQNKNIKVLYMSAHPHDTLKQINVYDEGTGFLRKPFDNKMLAGRIRMLLDGLA
ncbi:MAG: ATP-binding protein [candidate division KSB1 bacterium]|nr:ATP-binding protein [candidate division KSB1 bacterium]